MVLDEIDDSIREMLVGKLTGLQAIYVFGSRGQQLENSNSDFDIAFLRPLTSTFSKLDLFNLQEQLASRLHTDVDLIDLSAASLVFKFQIISTGKLIYCRQDFNSTQFEMKVMSMYQRFNLERADLLNEVTRTGKVYS